MVGFRAFAALAVGTAATASADDSGPPGDTFCPPLEPKLDECWHRYGQKWVRFFSDPQEAEAYQLIFNTGNAKIAENLRDFLDTAVTEVVATLQRPVSVDALSHTHLAVDALYGLRYSLCTVEFWDCYQSEADAEEAAMTYCSAAGQALTQLNVPLPADHIHFCTAFLIPQHIADAARYVLELVRSRPEPTAETPLYQLPVMFPRRYSPELMCHLLPGAAFTNGDFAEGSDRVDAFGTVVPHLSVETILKRIRRGGNVFLSRWVVNLGATNGLCGRTTDCYDPANCLIEEQHFNGLLVEGNESAARALHQRLADAGKSARKPLNDILVMIGFVTPQTVANSVLSHLPRLDVDLLKIDVDSVPHDELLKALLQAGLKPKVLHTEIGPWFPPPVAVWRDFEPSDALAYDEHPAAVGLNPSLARVDSVVRPFGYELLHVELADAVWVHVDYVDVVRGEGPKHDLYTKWLAGSFCHPGFARYGENYRFGRYDYRAWAKPSSPLEERLELMRALLRRAWGDDGLWHLELA